MTTANTIAVRVDNSLQPNSRWYSGSGIYRAVHLTLANPAYIEPHEPFITTPLLSDAESFSDRSSCAVAPGARASASKAAQPVVLKMFVISSGIAYRYLYPIQQAQVSTKNPDSGMESVPKNR